MDTSKKYVKMCEHAIEVQGQHRKKEDDLFFHRSYIKILASRLPGNHGCDTFLERHNEYNYKSKIRPKEWNDYCIWLPRQDQLQDIYWNERHSYIEKATDAEVLDLYFDSLKECYDLREEYIQEGYDYDHLKTMEQLWLAFVMKENYNKIWNGEDWITEEIK